MKEKKQYHYPVYIHEKQLVGGFYFHEIVSMITCVVLSFAIFHFFGLILSSIAMIILAMFLHKNKETRITLAHEVYLKIRYIFSTRHYRKTPRLEEDEVKKNEIKKRNKKRTKKTKKVDIT